LNIFLREIKKIEFSERDNLKKISLRDLNPAVEIPQPESEREAGGAKLRLDEGAGNGADIVGQVDESFADGVVDVLKQRGYAVGHAGGQGDHWRHQAQRQPRAAVRGRQFGVEAPEQRGRVHHTVHPAHGRCHLDRVQSGQ
jgi:hypothetical protein